MIKGEEKSMMMTMIITITQAKIIKIKKIVFLMKMISSNNNIQKENEPYNNKSTISKKKKNFNP